MTLDAMPKQPQMPKRPEIRKKKEAMPVVPGDTYENSRADLERSLNIIDTVQNTHVLDQKFLQGVWKGPEDLSERIRRIETLEALSMGEEKGEPHYLGDGSANAVSRRVFEGNPDVTAYVKNQSGEGAWHYDETTGAVNKISRTVDAAVGRVEKHEEPLVTAEAAENFRQIILNPASTAEEKDNALYKYGIWRAFSDKAKQLPATKKNVALAYGIKPEEVPLTEELTPRNGVEAGSMAMRGYAVSRIDQLFNLDSVPLTVLRTQFDGHDLASVQEAVPSSDPEKPARPFNIEDLDAFKEQGKDHPGARSIMRIACRQYLVKALDCHNENLLVDPVTKKATEIDPDLSLGLQTVETDANGDPVLKNGKPVLKDMDPYRSLPMEIIADHDDWKLDDEALAEFRRIYENTVSYLSLRATGEHVESVEEGEGGALNVGKPEADGKEIKYITQLFRQLYGNEKIASVEAQGMFVRLGEIIQNGRPPVKDLLEKRKLFRVSGFMERPAPQNEQAAQ